MSMDSSVWIFFILLNVLYRIYITTKKILPETELTYQIFSIIWWLGDIIFKHYYNVGIQL